MPAAGDQHLGSASKARKPDFYEEPRRQVPTYTAQEIATLQSRLEKQLGPEYLSSRSGPNGQKVHYIAAEKCIQLANAVFGFNGWSSQIIDFQVDFVDENPQTLKVSLGLSVVVRVTLKDGTFHEDIGYGHIENCKGKAAAFEKAKKEGTTDALKRALRNFGNVLGNCIYDKEYLKHVSKVKPFSPKWNEKNLFRHDSYIHPRGFKDLTVVAKEPANRKSTEADGKEVTESGSLPASNDSEEFFEDDFGDFDEADFGVADPNCHPDEVVLGESTPPEGQIMTYSHISKHNISGEPNNREADSLGTKSIQAPSESGESVKRQHLQHVPQTPNSGHSKITNTSSIARQDAVNLNKHSNQSSGNSAVANRILNQPHIKKSNQNSTLASPVLPYISPSNSPQEDEKLDLPILGSTFYSARAVNLLPVPAQDQNAPPNGPPDPIPPNAPLFNPHAESPSIRKTPGIDHKSSKPLTRDLKHVPSGSQSSVTSGISSVGSPGVFTSRANILNPSFDNVRRIGAPGSPSPNGLNVKGTGFRIPMKRATDGGSVRPTSGANRVPLEPLNLNGTMPEAMDPKRQKLHS